MNIIIYTLIGVIIDSLIISTIILKFKTKLTIGDITIVSIILILFWLPIIVITILVDIIKLPFLISKGIIFLLKQK